MLFVDVGFYKIEKFFLKVCRERILNIVKRESIRAAHNYSASLFETCLKKYTLKRNFFYNSHSICQKLLSKLMWKNCRFDIYLTFFEDLSSTLDLQ